VNNIGQESEYKSRAEFIREARESCARNLNPVAKGVGRRSFKNGNLSFNYTRDKNYDDSNYSINPVKKVLIKVICAFAIFIAVLTITSLDSRYNTNYGEKIHSWITSDASVERAEEFFVSLLEKINNK